MSTQTIQNIGIPEWAAFHSYLSVNPNDLFIFDPGVMRDSGRNHGGFNDDGMEGSRSQQAELQQLNQATSTTPTALRAPISIRTSSVSATHLSSAPAPPSGGPAFGRQHEFAMSSGQIDRGFICPQPGMHSAVGSSVSPADTMILTPSSTHYTSTSFRGSQEDIGSGDNDPILYPDTSPTSSRDGSYEFVSRVVSHQGSESGRMSANDAPRHANYGSAPSLVSQMPTATSATTTSFSGAHWGSMATSTSNLADEFDRYYTHPDHLVDMSDSYPDLTDDTYGTADQFDASIQTSENAFENATTATFNLGLPWRGLHDYTTTQHYYNMGRQPQHAYSGQRQAGFHYDPGLSLQQQHHLQAHHFQSPQGIYVGRDSVSQDQTTLQHRGSSSLRLAPPVISQPGLASLTRPFTESATRKVRRTAAKEGNQKSPTLEEQVQATSSQSKRRKRSKASPSSPTSQSSSAVRQVKLSYHPLVKAEPSSSPSSDVASLPRGRQRGGRQRYSHLPEDTRQRSSKMRKVAACWRCIMQRDSCDDGMPCGRCLMRSQKGQQYFFDCDRSKLPDFVHDFLPPTMTLMHQKQTIEDTVTEQVLEWDRYTSIDIYLTSGYGPPLRWKVHEFRPRDKELLTQLQYYQDPKTGISQGWKKYSPPFGLLKLEQSDDTHFEGYLDQLMDPEYLCDFGWICFEEENQIDPEGFQANLLDFVCSLYRGTEDDELKTLLQAIIRMMIITYIMGHTLTIVEDTLPSVLSNLKFSGRPSQLMRHTSPRLANRQLKFFFAMLRNNIYSEVLRRQQHTFHTSGKKESTWLTSFCAMLGFAMVLEEVQRTLQIQADAKVAREEMSEEQANTEANNACQRIDDRFDLLVGLFQCKYRDKTWVERGSFGPETPQLTGKAETSFLSSLRMLLEEKEDHLVSRRDVTCTPDNQTRFTSRLVARFLLPFLKLPSSKSTA